MGHLSIKTIQIYAEVTRTKINEIMTSLAEQLEGKSELTGTNATKKDKSKCNPIDSAKNQEEIQ